MVFSFDKFAHFDINQRIERFSARNITRNKIISLKVIFLCQLHDIKKLNTKKINN